MEIGRSQNLGFGAITVKLLKGPKKPEEFETFKKIMIMPLIKQYEGEIFGSFNNGLGDVLNIKCPTIPQERALTAKLHEFKRASTVYTTTSNNKHTDWLNFMQAQLIRASDNINRKKLLKEQAAKEQALQKELDTAYEKMAKVKK